MSESTCTFYIKSWFWTTSILPILGLSLTQMDRFGFYVCKILWALVHAWQLKPNAGHVYFTTTEGSITYKINYELPTVPYYTESDWLVVMKKLTQSITSIQGQLFGIIVDEFCLTFHVETFQGFGSPKRVHTGSIHDFSTNHQCVTSLYPFRHLICTPPFPHNHDALKTPISHPWLCLWPKNKPKQRWLVVMVIQYTHKPPNSK